jgi:hypothetical protein
MQLPGPVLWMANASDPASTRSSALPIRMLYLLATQPGKSKRTELVSPERTPHSGLEPLTFRYAMKLHILRYGGIE